MFTVAGSSRNRVIQYRVTLIFVVPECLLLTNMESALYQILFSKGMNGLGQSWKFSCLEVEQRPRVSNHTLVQLRLLILAYNLLT